MSTFLWLLAAAFGVWVFFRYFVSVKRVDKDGPADDGRSRASPQMEQQRPSLIAGGDDVAEYDLVGESNYQRDLLAMFGPRGERGIDVHVAAVLVAEPENQHDKNAVRCDIEGRKVGYLSRADAPDFRKYMMARSLASMPVVANVRGGWKNDSSEGSYGVKIEVSAAVAEDL